MLLLVALAGCQGEGPHVRTLVPIAGVTPTALDLGDVGVPSEGTATLYVSNGGLADLQVAPSLEGPGVFSLDQAGPFVVEPDGAIALTVTFAPETYQEYSGRLRLETNDDEHALWSIPIRGRGVDMAQPDIEIDPRTVEASPEPGSSALMGFEVRNVGQADLLLGELLLDGPPEFVPISWPSDTALPPGQQTTVVVQYTPTSEAGHCAHVDVPSNDLDEPTLRVTLLGNGADCERPVAHVDCPGEVRLAGPTWVELSGEGSGDPSGALPLQYAWSVTARPEASGGAELDPADTPVVDLYADVAGDWEVQLVVTNTLGVTSAPAVCALTARPEDALHVELSWDTAQADIDLHVSQYGYELYDVPQDCSYCNDTPSWGPGGAEDDPRLDLDDEGGYGPENINLFAPSDDYYQVRVHYFDDNGDGPVQATVQVWAHGALVATETRVMNLDEVWEVGTVDLVYDQLIERWPASEPLPQAERDDCPQ
jgi:hypothetical protein